MTRRRQSFQDHLGGHPMKRDCLFKTLPSKNWLPSTLHVQLSIKYLLDPLAVLQMKSLEFQVWGLIPKLWHRHVIGIPHTFQFFFSCLRKLFFGCVPLHRIRLYVQKVFFSSWGTKTASSFDCFELPTARPALTWKVVLCCSVIASFHGRSLRMPSAFT